MKYYFRVIFEPKYIAINKSEFIDKYRANNDKKIRLLDFVTGEEGMKSRNTVVNSDIWRGKK